MRFSKSELYKISSIVVDQGFSSGISFFTTIVLSRIWSVENYADYVLFFSIAMLVLGFQRALISQPFTIYKNDFDKDGFKSYLNSNIWYKLIYTAVIGIIFPILFLVAPLQVNSKTVLFYTLFVIAHSSYFFVKDILLGLRCTKLNLYYSLIVNLLSGFLLLLLFLTENTLVESYLGPISIVFLLAFICFCQSNRSFLKVSFTKAVGYFKYNWTIGKWSAGANLFYSLSSQIYPWLLLWFLTKKEVAIYGVLISISSLVKPITTSLHSYLLPVFTIYFGNRTGLSKIVRNWLTIYAILALSLVLAGLLQGEYIIELFFGEKYSNLGLIVLLPFIDQGINIVFQPLDIALHALKRTDVGFWLLILRSILAISLGIFLVQHYGILGVFITRILVNILTQTVNVNIYRRIVKK